MPVTDTVRQARIDLAKATFGNCDMGSAPTSIFRR